MASATDFYSATTIALLQTPAGDSWKVQLKKDMHRLKQVVGHKLAELNPESLQMWTALWRQFPGQWKGFIKDFLVKAAKRVGEADQLEM